MEAVDESCRGAERGALRLRLALVAALALVLFAALASAASAASQSQNVALVPNAGENEQGGGSPLPLTNFPNGYAPSFTDVSLAALEDPNSNPIVGMDTVVLVTCNTGELMADATAKSRLQSFVTGGGKLIISDAECNSPPPDYSGFFFPFETSTPGQAGATGGTLDIVEDSSLASPNPASPSYINGDAVGNDTDAIGDANVMTTLDQNWCLAVRASNSLGAVGPVEAYVHFGNGLIIWWGLDTDDVIDQYDASSTAGDVHLSRMWLLQLLQSSGPDNLQCGQKIFGLALTPKTATNNVGTNHTVTATVSKEGNPVAGNTVTFKVTSGPNAGKTGTGITDANGRATFTYAGTGGAGTDTIEADSELTVEPTPVLTAAQSQQVVPVSDTAHKTWVAPTQQVAGAQARPAATAHAALYPRCVRSRLPARVSGREITKVTFSVDGKRKRVVTRRNADGKFAANISVRKLKAGRHRLSSRIVFSAASAAPARTVRTGFVVCKRRVRPAFTG